MQDGGRYRDALLDWLACATAGAAEPAPQAARRAGDGLLERVAWAGCAGHVLDFDDTYAPGLVHASAPVAPAALLLAAELDRDAGVLLDAYAAGFEATAALARAGHPELYERGWHPTAVCGTVGAAVACARVLELDESRTEQAAGLALLRAAGLQAAFGSHGKALQVGMAAAAGTHCARLTAAGAEVRLEEVAHGRGGFEHAFGASWPAALDGTAVRDNWIKPYPSCLATHSAIECAAELRADGGWDSELTVVVHPRARQGAVVDDPADGLQAKFSIAYLTAFTLLHGTPDLASFAAVDPRARTLGARISVRTDPALGEMEARLEAADRELARVQWALGSPARPMDQDMLAAKRHRLSGERLDGVLEDRAAPAREVAAAAGLA